MNLKNKKFLIYTSGLTDHMIMKKKNGNFIGWGFNGYGALGLGDIQNRSFPVEMFLELKKKGKIKRIFSLGYYTTFVQLEDNRIFSAGVKLCSELLVGDKSDKNVFTQVNSFPNDEILNINSGIHFIMVKTKNGLFVCGDNSYGLLGISNFSSYCKPVEFNFQKEIKEAINGRYHSLLFTKENELYMKGQFGDDSNTEKLTYKLLSIPNEQIEKVYSGWDHVVVITKSNKVFGIGDNYKGRLTKELCEEVSSFKQIKCLNGSLIHDIKCGELHTLVLLKDGTLLGFGEVEYFGSKSNSQIDSKSGIVTIMKDIIQIESMTYSTIAIDKQNRMWVGGSNSNGELGLGHFNDVYDKMVINTNINLNEIGIESDDVCDEFMINLYKKCVKKVIFDVFITIS